MAILIIDGVCNLCTWSARFVIKRDKKRRIKIAALQSEEGQYLLHKYQIDPSTHKTSILITEHGNKVYCKTSAALEVCRLLPFPWPLLNIFKCIPKCIRDWLYDFLIPYRYKLFGKKEYCLTPNPDTQEYFVRMEELL